MNTFTWETISVSQRRPAPAGLIGPGWELESFTDKVWVLLGRVQVGTFQGITSPERGLHLRLVPGF